MIIVIVLFAPGVLALMSLRLTPAPLEPKFASGYGMRMCAPDHDDHPLGYQTGLDPRSRPDKLTETPATAGKTALVCARRLEAGIPLSMHQGARLG